MKKGINKNLIIIAIAVSLIIAGAVLVNLVKARVATPESEGLHFGLTEEERKESAKRKKDLSAVEKWFGDGDILVLSETNYRWESGKDYIEGTSEIFRGEAVLAERMELEKVIDEYADEIAGIDPEASRGYLKRICEKWGRWETVGTSPFVLKEHISKTVVDGQEIESIDSAYVGYIQDGELHYINLRTQKEKVFVPYTGEEVEEEKKETVAVQNGNFELDCSAPTGYKVVDESAETLVMTSEDGKMIIASINENYYWERYKSTGYAPCLRYQVYETEGDAIQMREQFGPHIEYGVIMNEKPVVMVSANDKDALSEFCNSIKF